MHRNPQTRVERLARQHVDSPIFPIRMHAASILCNLGVRNSWLYMAPVSQPLRRYAVARHARAIRRELQARQRGFGAPAYLEAQIDQHAAQAEAQNEGRLMPPRRPNPHGEDSQ